MPGSLFIVSAPSGAGKTTLVRELLARDPGVRLSVSYTTRAPRAGEVDGVAYHFTDRADFIARRDRGEFLEWAEVHGNYYASSRIWLEEQMRAGQDVLLEIDWQGAVQVRRIFPQAVGVFVLAPSYAELENRLRGRGTDSEDVIARRLAAACEEMKQVDQFDYVIINKDLQVAAGELQCVVRAARLRTPLMRRRSPQSFFSAV
ncbi:MAG: guanylate kinase [Candidatus Dactylopiibacterium carminicum]|uniref:Guanylate kinase n=1 Tax=Candidatus Dactylopiibacterium carminicum TaxID=857335 RepID=A0A272EQJ3_9RHOO|nr:guanylate kinase [Candidatus Dactylopiibacterium carminicum]KAF7598627.1 guanylate kinase [Candidatus Dactylopiibacterium carminicum]PAS92393.1 MAG: guanylate kinase [Candidatus Dactylopiibacterium carminicum]PAS96014.1 MAG: guanylate kinase [Candidatus Dactylopiibacterium carminicum]PAS98394.1 MAG: guanylate kinase [Candidatus Dactylopiibacterium carminicum]